jgi:hypothetical protein
LDGYLYAYDPDPSKTTENPVADMAVKPPSQRIWAQGTTSASGNGIPFTGNIDSEPNPEILTVSNNQLNGFRWDGNQSLTKVYSRSVVDDSGATGITLFDFNQDNITELVYRDQSNLRIMKAAGTSFPDIKAFGAMSGTSVEHPIVVDVDNDGHAEIVTAGGTSSIATTGRLRIFNSGNGTTRAPARKIWNRYACNAVNVNDDLTIPRYQLNPRPPYSPARTACRIPPTTSSPITTSFSSKPR